MSSPPFFSSNGNARISSASFSHSSSSSAPIGSFPSSISTTQSLSTSVSRYSRSRHAPKPIALRAPVINPYDKFTQPQFDEWIGDITSALKGALGFRAETSADKVKTKKEWHVARSASEDVEEEDYVRQPTTADAKGKGRDPREGPGLGRGDRDAPIEIDMESDEDEVDDGNEEGQDSGAEYDEEADEGGPRLRLRLRDLEGEEEEEDEEGVDYDLEEGEEEELEEDDEEEDDDDEEEEELAIRHGESSARAHARWSRKHNVSARDDEPAEDEEPEEEMDEADIVEVYSDEDMVQNHEELALNSPFLRYESHEDQDEAETGSESEEENEYAPPVETVYLMQDKQMDELAEEDQIGSSPHADPSEVVADYDGDDEQVKPLGSSPPPISTNEHLTLAELLQADIDAGDDELAVDYADVLPGSSPIATSSPDFGVDGASALKASLRYSGCSATGWDDTLHYQNDDDEDNEDGDPRIPPLEIFDDSSDELPTFEAVPTDPSAPLTASEQDYYLQIGVGFGYVVEEAESETEGTDGQSEARVISRTVSIEPQNRVFFVEEPMTDYDVEEHAEDTEREEPDLNGEVEGVTNPSISRNISVEPHSRLSTEEEPTEERHMKISAGVTTVVEEVGNNACTAEASEKVELLESVESSQNVEPSEDAELLEKVESLEQADQAELPVQDEALVNPTLPEHPIHGDQTISPLLDPIPMPILANENVADPYPGSPPLVQTVLPSLLLARTTSASLFTPVSGLSSRASSPPPAPVSLDFDLRTVDTTLPKSDALEEVQGEEAAGNRDSDVADGQDEVELGYPNSDGGQDFDKDVGKPSALEWVPDGAVVESSLEDELIGDDRSVSQHESAVSDDVKSEDDGSILAIPAGEDTIADNSVAVVDDTVAVVDESDTVFEDPVTAIDDPVVVTDAPSSVIDDERALEKRTVINSTTDEQSVEQPVVDEPVFEERNLFTVDERSAEEDANTASRDDSGSDADADGDEVSLGDDSELDTPTVEEPVIESVFEPVIASTEIDAESGVKNIAVEEKPQPEPISSAAMDAKHEESERTPPAVTRDFAEVITSDQDSGTLKRKRDENDDDNDDQSATSKASKVSVGSVARARSKGKEKAIESDEENAEETSSNSSMISKLLVPSRSPSPRVVTIQRTAHALPPPPPPAPPPPPVAPPTLWHRHSVKPVRQNSMTTIRPSVERTPSTSSTSSSVASLPTLPATTSTNTSPMTRSQCRYRRIDLPEDSENPDSPRICFIVPGCSLGSSDLIAEADIRDLGDATTEDSHRMVSDIEGLDFSSDLIGIVRQLVGLDILREGEVFYLPRDGEEVRGVKKQLQPLKRERSSRVTNPDSSPRPPVSNAGSTSTNASVSRGRRRGSPTPSWAYSQRGDSTDEELESPADRRIRTAEMEGVAAAASGSPLRTRRSRRLDVESAEYRPDQEDDVDDDPNTKAKKKKKAKGKKRARQSEAPEDDAPRMKKLKG
ncbi:unnamed protein product [Mycena citricolor]|uniref:Uncharacterized protein n=1 Tax=Mycena citricolor TaxID=2018698 RepID=A0AAD2K6E0_9AGAR|nr:unnamed protein product [Mycena citricolor]